MNNFNNFEVRPWNQDAIRITWPRDGNPDFDHAAIERSESPEGPFDKIAPPIQDDEYLDQPVNLQDKWRVFYYRVTLRDKDGENLKTFGPGRIQTNPDMRALEIVRRERLLLREYISPDNSWVIKKRSEGDRCPDCWDPIKMRVKDSNCGTCNGTGFVDGYLDPIPVYVSYSSANKLERPSTSGTKQESKVQAWTSNYPDIRPRDILVEPYFSNKRWRVANVKPTRKGRYPLRQIMTLTQLDPSSSAMDIKVPENTPSEEVPGNDPATTGTG